MGVSKNGGTQQPWVFLLKMIILGCFGGTIIFGNTYICSQANICAIPNQGTMVSMSFSPTPSALEQVLTLATRDHRHWQILLSVGPESILMNRVLTF